MIGPQTKQELVRLVTSGLSIGAASDKVGVSRSTGQRWIQRLKVGKDAQQSYEERQHDRALNAGGGPRAATERDIASLWLFYWDGVPLKRAARAEGIRLDGHVLEVIRAKAAEAGEDFDDDEREAEAFFVEIDRKYPRRHVDPEPEFGKQEHEREVDEVLRAWAAA